MLAVRQHLDQFAGYVDRDYMPDLPTPYAVIMQGWFTKNPHIFPLPQSVRPIWVGFHLGLHAAHLLERPEVRNYLSAWGMVGCRDDMTARLLQEAGISAEVSGCLTTTFPRREKEPKSGKVFLVNTSGIPLPRAYRDGPSTRIDQEGAAWWSAAAKRALAAELLQLYREQAKLVITTRLHCALPCVAMGIPVVMLGDESDSRLDPIKGLAEFIPFPNALRNERTYSRLLRKKLWAKDLRHRDWVGFAADIEERKATLIGRLQSAISATPGATP